MTKETHFPLISTDVKKLKYFFNYLIFNTNNATLVTSTNGY